MSSNDVLPITGGDDTLCLMLYVTDWFRPNLPNFHSFTFTVNAIDSASDHPRTRRFKLKVSITSLAPESGGGYLWIIEGSIDSELVKQHPFLMRFERFRALYDSEKQSGHMSPLV